MRLLKRFFAWIGSLVRRRRFIGQSGATVVVAPVDTTPNAFTFTDVSGAALSTVETSNTITVAGLGSGVSVAVTVSGGTFSKNGGGYSSTPTTAQNGDTFAVRHTSSASNSTATNTTLTIGGVSDTFTSTTLAAATGTLAAPTLGYPTAANPPTIAITIPESWQSGNVLKLAYSSAEAMSSPTVLTHTLTDSDTPGSTISISIPTLGGVTYFRAYGNDGADSANVSNIVKWGDSTAPTITTSSTASQMELFTLGIALTANETVTWSIVGGADQTQFDISGSTLRWFGNGTANYDAPTDIDQNNTYAVTVRATDLGGNTTDQTITVTVTQADKTPNTYTFTDVIPATPSTQYTSNTITVAGLTASLSVPVTVTGGATYSKNGGSYTSAAGTAVNGDTFALRVTSGSGATDVLHLGLNIGLGSASWTVSNTTNTAGWTTTNGASKNANITVSGAANLTIAVPNNLDNELVRANQSASGKRYWEFTVDAGTTGSIALGLDDGTASFGAASTPNVPGNATATGLSFVNGSWGWEIKTNSVVRFSDYASGTKAVAVGDKIGFEHDSTTNTIQVWRKKSGTWTSLGSVSTSVPAGALYAFAGSAQDSNTLVNGTANFGLTAFDRTPSTGFTGYGS